MTARLALLALVLLGPPPEDLERDAAERFLRTARIASNVAVGQGITGARILELEADGQRRRAVFKAVDERVEVDYHFGKETATEFRDSFRHELAAYELDKLLGLGLVPPVVERKIDGRPGSLQVWVARTNLRFVRRLPLPSPESSSQYVHAVRLLDYLIFNTDRHLRNLFFDEQWRPVVIDHSMAFHSFTRPARPLHRFPREPVARLRALDRRRLERALGDYLHDDQLDALEARRLIALELVDRAVTERGSDEALFDWSH